MERSKSNGQIETTSVHNQLPDYSSKAVQDALRHLASIDLIDLCNEAKVERCRASRDLRSCGRLVDSVLSSCGHASLCTECSQRCENCPICRTPLLKNGNVLRRRLYYECTEAGLICKVSGDRCQEKEDEEAHLTADVGRLYSLFDVALENNLCCLICQYVLEVCMDESAVSSDPVTAFLLDEVVVKDWCKRTFKNIIEDAKRIYNLEINEMIAKTGALVKLLGKLVGLSDVLEVLESSFKDTLSARLDDLHHLQECILKTKQHMELMIWCSRHQFLVNIRSRHNHTISWRALLRARKNAAVVRAWPETPDHSGDSTVEDCSSLFIEDALLNLEVDKGHEFNAIELEVASLQLDGGQSFSRYKVEGLGGCYPFENVRAAVDTLFLCGSSDMVVSKQAIFLYYLFDRHWTLPDEEWRWVVDDLAATFSITRHSLLESLTFYLLDDHTDEALQEACRLLPEISSPESHPKIAKVLLERQNPDSALMFLRWSGRDNSVEVSLSEAIMAVRIRMECGLFTEAFMYQRMLWMRVKETQAKHIVPVDASDNLEEDFRSWTDWVLVLVTEICCLCVRRNFLDQIIELPWNSDEERYFHKCLLDFATAEPHATAGSLLVVYYLQRYRYIEAYHIDRKLQTLEQDFISNNNVNEEVLVKMKSSAEWRAGLVNRSLELLPEVLQQELRAGSLTDNMGLYQNEVEVDKSVEPGLAATGPSASSSSLQSSLIFQMDPEISYHPFQDGHNRNNISEAINLVSPLLSRGDLFANSERSSKPPLSNGGNFKVDDILTPITYSKRTSSVKSVYKTASRLFQNDPQDGQVDDFFSPVEQNGMYGQFTKVSPPSSRRVMAKPTRIPSGNRGLIDDSPQERYKTATGKRLSPGDPERPRYMATSNDPMDTMWSQKANGCPANFPGGAQRWRSDETSDDEEQPSLEQLGGSFSRPTPTRKGAGRGRVLRR